MSNKNLRISSYLRKYFLAILMTTSSLFIISAQVGIGKDSVDGSGILDFGADDNKGILLPRTIGTLPGVVPGTLYFDTSDSKVKFLGSSVVDLSVKAVSAGNEFDVMERGYVNLTEEATTQGTVIGDLESGAPGVLVLDSTEHALILPKVSSYTNIGSPEAGMIVYDTSTKLFCVYDGEKWAFWGK